jgi:pimeloyl-ACP methyl ester carboxylesterase
MHHEGQVVLPQVLNAAGVERAVLVGHSDGGSIALVHAGSGAGGANDPRVTGVISMAAHVFNEPISVASIEKAREAYLEGKLRASLARYHTNVENAFWGWNQAWLDPGFLDWNLEEFLPGVTVPTLAIQGKQDPYGTAAQVEAIASQVGGPVETLWPDPCGHAAFRDRPEAVLAASRAFLVNHALLPSADYRARQG